jgi:hypothetical protein
MFEKYKTKSELLKFLKAELKGTQSNLAEIKKKFPDTRKVKKNDMYYGEMVDRVILLADVIHWVKDLEDVK